MLNWATPSRFKARTIGCVFQWAYGTPQTVTRAVNKRALSADFSSARALAAAAAAVPDVPLIVF